MSDLETQKLKLLYAGLYLALGIIPKERSAAIVRLQAARLPPLSKVTQAIEKELSGIDRAVALRRWRWLTRDSTDRILLCYVRGTTDTLRGAQNLGATIAYQVNEINVEQILKRGEQFYLETNPDPGFIKQISTGKFAFLGHDKKGHPLCTIRAARHFSGNQSRDCARRFTLLCFEMGLMVQNSEMSNTSIYDLSGWSLENVDYHTIIFLITCANKYYPGFFHQIIVHNAPVFFVAVWKILKPMLDTSLSKLIVFTRSTKQLTRYVDLDQLPHYLGGTLNYDFDQWVPPRAEDDVLLREYKGREHLLEQRHALLDEIELLTCEWLMGESNQEQRDNVLSSCTQNYWALDPYVRSRMVWDRHGILGKYKSELAPGGIAQPYTLVHEPTRSPMSSVVDGKGKDFVGVNRAVSPC